MLSYSVAVKNAKLDQIETTIGASALLRCYNGSVPTNADAALGSNTMLANGALPSDWMTNASGGSKGKSGTWSLTGNASLGAAQAATFFRITDSTGNTPGIQGTVGANVALSTNANTAQYSNVLNFAATTGVVAGMNVVGANIPANAQVLQVNAANVVISEAANVALVSPLSVTFCADMAIDNNSIAANQSLSVSVFTINSGN
jgi:hypothetical protein